MSEKVRSYEGDQPYIFISYAHKDIDRVMKVLRILDQRGYRLWYDDGIAPGSEWPEYIATHLDQAEAVISFVTEGSVESSNCRREITFALSRNKPFISVFFEQVVLPLGLELQISAQQSVLRYNYDSEEAFLEKLCSTPAFQPCRKTEEELHPEVKAAAAQPVAENVTRPVAEKAAQPVAEKAAQPAVENVTQPAAEESPQPVEKELVQPVAEENAPSEPGTPSAPTPPVEFTPPGNRKGLLYAAIGAAAVIIVVIAVVLGGRSGKFEGLGTGSFNGSAAANSDKEVTNWTVEDENVTGEMIAQICGTGKLTNLYFKNCTFDEGALAQIRMDPDKNLVLSFVDCAGMNDLSFLQNLGTFYHLQMQNCGLTDSVVPDLSGVSIQWLDFSGNPGITKLSLNQEELLTVELGGTGITEVDFLAEAKHVYALDLNHTPISDLSPIAPLANIKRLNLSGVPMEAFIPGFMSLGLEELNLNGCGLTSSAELQDYVRLKSVDLGNNSLSDVSFLQDSVGTLVTLDISGNNLKGDALGWIGQAAGLTSLKLDRLDLSESQLAFLEGLTDLRYLSARDCGLTDISVLSDIKTLEFILLGFNEIKDVPSQLGLNAEGRAISCLDLAQNQVSDITPLMTNCNCYDLVLVGNPITKYSTEKENCLLDRIWIDYFDGIENADLRPLDFMSVVGCPRKVMQPLSEKHFNVKFNTRAEQLELMKSTISSYTNYDGFEDEFLAIPEP